MSKFSLKSFIAGVTVAGLVMGATAFADSVLTDIRVEANAVNKIVINGEDKTPPSEKQPFIYNDNTYVPLRYISESMYKNVKWEDGNIYIDGVNVPQADADAIYALMDANIKHSNDKDIEAYMGDLSKNMDPFLLDATRNSLTQLFAAYTLEYKLTDMEIVAFDGNTCDLRATVETRKIAGTYSYANNRSVTVQKMVNEDGAWKLSNSYVEKYETIAQ